MKMKLFFSSALFAIMMCFSIQSSAQTGIGWNDTMMVFNEPLKFISGGNFIGAGIGFKFKAGSELSKATMVQAKKLSVPSSVRISTKPVVLRHNGKCYMFKCDPACSNCKLVWWDRNGDGEVQPRRELRCVKAKGQTGKISVTKIPCQ
ncbi:MAG: hypothetical protein AAF927_22555 [Bacteroidota bacterium]